jgi:hypothetical protein
VSNEGVPSPGGKGFWGSLPGLLTGIAALVTAGGTVLGVVLTQGPDEPPPPEPTVTVTTNPPTDVPTELSTPDPATASSAVPAAQAPQTGCPLSANTFWLEFPSVPYGPYDGYYVAWDSFGYYVWDPLVGWIAYGYPQEFNIWIDLSGSPFYLCLDSTGAVFGESIV